MCRSESCAVAIRDSAAEESETEDSLINAQALYDETASIGEKITLIFEVDSISEDQQANLKVSTT